MSQKSFYELQNKVWQTAAKKYAVGSIVKGEICSFTHNGCWVSIVPGLEALMCVIDAAQQLVVGREVHARVISIEPERHRLVIKEN